MATGLRQRTWTLGEYERMIECGLLGKDDRVELIEGEIVEMSPIGDRHRYAVNRLNMVFAPLAVGRAIVQVQGPIAVPPDSMPEPDVALLAWRDDFYRRRVTAADVVLAVEVADSSVISDRRVTIPLYGRAGIPEAWLVDLPAGLLEVFTSPSADGYGERVAFRPGDRVAPAALPDVEVAVADLVD